MRRCCTILLAMTLVATCTGQTAIGNRVGLGLWKLELPDASDQATDGRPATLACPQVALVADIPLSHWLYLRPELGFAQRGGRLEDVPFYGFGGLQRYSADIRINCLEVSLNALVGSDRGRWGLQAMLGASGARRLTLRNSLVGGPYAGKGEDGTFEVDDLSVRTGAIYLNGGAVFRRSFGALKVFIEYRYQQGMSSIENSEFVDLTDDRTMERGHVLSIGLLIPVKRDAWSDKAAPAPDIIP